MFKWVKCFDDVNNSVDISQYGIRLITEDEKSPWKGLNFESVLYKLDLWLDRQHD